MREFKQLQDESLRLKKVVAELTLDKLIVQDVVQKNGLACAEATRGRLRDGMPSVNELHH